MENLKLVELKNEDLQNLNGGVAPIVYAAGWATIYGAALTVAYFKGYGDAEDDRCYEE